MDKVDKQGNPYNNLVPEKQTKNQRIYSFGANTAAEYKIKPTVGDAKTILGKDSASAKDGVYDSFLKTSPIK